MVRLYNTVKKSFLVGLVAILPVYVTIWVVWKVLAYVDTEAVPRLEPLVGEHHIPGLGLGITFLVIVFAGFTARYLTRFVVFRRASRAVEEIIGKLPLVRTVYAAVKQVLLPLLGDEQNRAFKQVVLFEWPGEDQWVMGFVVKEEMGGHELNDCEDCEHEPSPDDRVLIFLPTNHLHLGFVIATRRGKLRPIDMTIEEAIQTQLSLGVAAPSVRFQGLE